MDDATSRPKPATRRAENEMRETELLLSVYKTAACATRLNAIELIGPKVDVSGEFIAEFELVFVQEP